MYRSIFIALSAAASVSGCLCPASAQAPAKFDIAPQPLESALIQFAIQARISLSVPPSGLGALRSEGLHGALPVEEGLRLLLRGSNLTFEQVAPAAYRISFLSKAPAQEARLEKAEAPEVVIVSARVPANVMELPRDVTYIDGAELSDGGMRSDLDLLASIGGLSFTNLGPGRDKVFIRGLSDGAVTGRTQSPVGIYFDNTRITYRAPDPDLQLVDMKSIEVLRGPQGALYGAGAISGILRMESRQPDPAAWSGSLLLSAETTTRGDPGSNTELTLNAPLIPGVFGLRGVIYDERTGGWLDNQATGGKNTNAARRRGARVSGLFALDDEWSVRASAINQQIDTRDAQYLQQTPGGLQRTARMAEPHDNDFSMLNFTVNGETSWGRLTSSTSYIRHQYGSRFDATSAFPDFAPAPGESQPVDEEDSLAILVHETTLVFPSGAGAPFLAGIFYADGDNRRDFTLRTGAAGTWNSLLYAETRTDNIDELALFGQASIPLAGALSLNLGLRGFRSSLETRSAASQQEKSPQEATTQRNVFAGIAPDIRLLYNPSRDFLVFLSGAKGYRNPGFNTGGPLGQSFTTQFQPFGRYADDHVWTYEIGSRFRFPGKRLELQVTAFDSDWRDIQTDDLARNGFLYTGNVGDARAAGVEMTAHYVLASNLSLDLHALVNKTRISQRSPTFPGVKDGGLPGSPGYSASGLLHYDDDVVFAGMRMRAFAQIDARYVSASRIGFTRDQHIGGYGVSDIRLGVDFRDWQFQVFVSNIGSSGGATFSTGNPYQAFSGSVTPERPRTIGASVVRAF